MMRPSTEQLLGEAALLAHAFHWSLDSILDLEHPDRHRFVAEAAALTVSAP